MKIGDPLARTPDTSLAWRFLSDGARKEAVKWALKVIPVNPATWSPIDVLSATPEGRVTLCCDGDIDNLLGIERHLRRWVSEGIELMLEPAVDANKQRAFRGVQVL